MSGYTVYVKNNIYVSCTHFNYFNSSENAVENKTWTNLYCGSHLAMWWARGWLRGENTAIGRDAFVPSYKVSGAPPTWDSL